MKTEKKIFKGFVPGLATLADIISWDNDVLYLEPDWVVKEKGQQRNWLGGNWPPKQVTITVEIVEGVRGKRCLRKK